MASEPRRPCPTSSARSSSTEKSGRREIGPWAGAAAAEAAAPLGSTYSSAWAHAAGLSSLPSPAGCASGIDCPSPPVAGTSGDCTGGITGTGEVVTFPWAGRCTSAFAPRATSLGACPTRLILSDGGGTFRPWAKCSGRKTTAPWNKSEQRIPTSQYRRSSLFSRLTRCSGADVF